VGRRRIYLLDDAHLRPLHECLYNYEQSCNKRLDRLDNYLGELQRKEKLQ
jgi:hypothetical protein